VDNSSTAIVENDEPQFEMWTIWKTYPLSVWKTLVSQHLSPQAIPDNPHCV
jgi:hypothetical protein